MVKNPDQTTVRFKVITILQSFAIWLVVLGHSLPFHNTTGARPTAAQWIYDFVFSFHIHLFIFISGFLFIYTNLDRQIVYGKYLLKKVNRLLLPYAFLSTIAFLAKSRLSQYAMRPISPTFTYYIKGLVFADYNPIVYFWFIPTIFILLAIAPLFKKILLKNNVIVSSGVLLLLVTLNVVRPLKTKFLCFGCAADTAVYFYLGCFVSYYFREKLNYMCNYYLAALLLLALILSTTFPLKLALPINLFKGVIGIAFSISLAQIVKGTNILKSLHGYYYQIYLLSWFPQVFFMILYKQNLTNYFLAVICMLFSGLYAPVLVTKFAKKRMGKFKVVIGL